MTPDHEHIVKRVSEINATLREKDFTITEIDRFWARISRLGQKMEAENLTLDDIKVCTGCGHLNIEPLGPTAMACCPDERYVQVKSRKTQTP